MKRLVGVVVSILWFASAGLAAVRPARVLVLYDQGKDARQPALAEARYLENLLGHFAVEVTLSPLLAYQQGDLRRYDQAFYITYEKKFPLPAAFAADFFVYQGTFCWINRQLPQLDQNKLAAQFGFRAAAFVEESGFTQVRYRGVLFPKGDENLQQLVIDDHARVAVVAAAVSAKGTTVPYIVRSRNLWVVADSPFSFFTEEDRYVAFADLLHDILGQDHPEEHNALVRIEDINPLSDPADLLRMARYLNSQKVPFAVGVSAVYIDAVRKTEYHLADRPELLAALKKLPSLGGSIVMHGYTHQYRGVTTDDYEFWDEAADRPVRGDSVESASRRVEKGLKELFADGLYPVAWETPHYFASPDSYRAFKKYFSLAYDRRGVMPYLGSDQFFPYPVHDRYGQQVIPENLGYVHLDAPDAQHILRAARLNTVVRDGYASFFFHPFVDMRYLRDIVRGLKDMGFTFRDIRDFMPAVTARDKALVTADAAVTIETQAPYISIRAYDRRGREKRRTVVDTPAGAAYTAQITCPANQYVVVKPQDERDPGFFQKIWRLAKADLTYLGEKTIYRTSERLAAVQDVAVIMPSRPSRLPEENTDAASLKYSLAVAGVPFAEFPAAHIDGRDLREFDIIILPAAAARSMSAAERQSVIAAVASGSHLVIDGPSPVAEALGIEQSVQPVTVRRARDYQYPDIPLFWQNGAESRPILRAAEKDYTVLCADEETNLPLAVVGMHGKGSFIFFAPLFDPVSGRGYARFPFLLEMLETAFDYAPLAARAGVEMYFDPGLRQNISIEKLARLWRQHNIRAIYAGGWHFYDKYSYDYARLIRVCHENGILVYCWLEPPLINQKFWNKYPQWREKTATLKDAKVAWRHLMNLADPACRKKAFAEIESLLLKYDWDGVNVAELYFESVGGPAHPETLTPMNRIVRAAFSRSAGFDPLELFNPASRYFWKTNPSAWQSFAAYRRDLCARQKDQFLAMLAAVAAKKKDFEVMLTAIDVTVETWLSEYIAEDTGHTLALQKKYGCTLQIEDPMVMWGGTPERYAALGQYYRRYIPDKNRLVLDCNVLVDNHPFGAGGLPAAKPAGEEMRQIAYNMDLFAARTAFYSEDSVYENDYRGLAAVLARDARVKVVGDMAWAVNTPRMVTVRTGNKNLIARLDGELWFAGDGDTVIVPAGDHTLQFETEPRYFDMARLKPRLLSISADLVWAEFANRTIEFSYAADRVPCYVLLNKRPGTIRVDDKKISAVVLEHDGLYTVKLPSGTRVAKIVVGGALSGMVEAAGVVLLSLIMVFGFVTSALLLGLFILIRIKRKLGL